MVENMDEEVTGIAVGTATGLVVVGVILKGSFTLAKVEKCIGFAAGSIDDVEDVAAVAVVEEEDVLQGRA